MTDLQKFKSENTPIDICKNEITELIREGYSNAQVIEFLRKYKEIGNSIKNTTLNTMISNLKKDLRMKQQD